MLTTEGGYFSVTEKTRHLRRVLRVKITALSLQMGINDYERRIVWYADYGTKNAAVQYMQKSEYLLYGGFNNAKIVFGTVENIFANNENVSCKVRLENLIPATEYIYRVGDGINFDNKTYCFFTQSKDILNRSFAVISDLHCMYKPDAPHLWEYRRPQWNNTINSINAYDPNIAFLLSAGDNISSYNMGMDDEKEKMRLICEKEHEFLFEPELMKNLAFATVMGNHEAQYYNDADHYSSPAHCHYDMPNDDSISGHFKYDTAGDFCFQSGNVLVIGINFTVDGAANRPNTDFESTERYVKKAVELYPDALWRVMITHIQGFTFIGDSKEVETPYMMKKQDELCSKYNIDLMLTGHAHGFSRSYPIKDGEPIKNTTENINGVDTVLNANATVHYNIPSALNHSFTSVFGQYKKYLKSYGVAKMRSENPIMPKDITEYDSPMFLHIKVDETKEQNSMLIKVIQSKDLVSVDDFRIVKYKKKNV